MSLLTHEPARQTACPVHQTTPASQAHRHACQTAVPVRHTVAQQSSAPHRDQAGMSFQSRIQAQASRAALQRLCLAVLRLTDGGSGEAVILRCHAGSGLQPAWAVLGGCQARGAQVAKACETRSAHQRIRQQATDTLRNQNQWGHHIRAGIDDVKCGGSRLNSPE